jgi:catechol 2,3-dioxygenase-like lactoylglutathione lyase family enzyme
MIEKLTTMLPVADLAAAVDAWSSVLGAEPTFVDGDRWAQFDLAGTRLALAGTDRVGFGAGIMAKVVDLDSEHARLCTAGLAPAPIERGPHERRFAVEMPGGGFAIYYSPA